MAILIEKHVEASADDADETSGGAVKITTKVFEFGNSLAARRLGFLFKNITCPSGSTVTTATFSIWIPTGTTKLEMKCALFPMNDAAPASFEEKEKNIVNRERPKHYVEWNAKMKAGEYNALTVPPEIIEYMIGTLGQKVGAGNWVKGNNIALELSQPAVGCETEVEQWDNLKTTTHSAKLSFEYEPPAEMQTLC